MEVAMKPKRTEQGYANRSLLSVVLTAIVITINHWYRLGPLALVLGAVLLAVPAGFWLWFRRRRNRVALAAYLAMNVWIVVGFGLFKGFWKTVLPLAGGVSIPGPIGMEVSGVLTMVGGLVVAYTASRLVAETRVREGSRLDRPQVRRAAFAARSTATLLVVLIGGWVGSFPVAQARAVGTTQSAHSDHSTSAALADAPIKIGVIATTRGPAGLLGSSFLRSIQLAKEERPGTRRHYELAIEEIPSPDQAEPAIRKLVQSDKVSALIVAMSMSGEIIKPYAAAGKIPLFCICSVGSLGDELSTFTTMPLAEDEASLWVAEAQRRGIKRIARFTQDFPSIDNHVRAIKADAEKAGLSFVYEDRFAPTTVDFRSAIAAAKAVGPDLYYVEGFNPVLDILGQQLRDAGVRNVASVVAFSISDAPDLFEGGWYTDSYISPAFKARLEQRYPGARLATHMMPYAYDSYKMLVDAFESGENPLSYIRRMTEFRGTAGTITKAAGTGNFRSAPAVWQITNGRPALLTR
jgi:ABC-type branched-subunit amino acid transport system substrate-binding protein